jgi:ABC-2 type transport system permease protein
MSSIGTIVRKEVKELLTPSTLAPILIMALVFAMIGNLASGVTTPLTEKPTIGLIDQDNSNLSRLACENISENSKVIYNGSSVETGLSVVENGSGLALLVIPAGFSSDILSNKSGTVQVYWEMRGAGVLDSIPLSTVSRLLAKMDRTISASLMGDHPSTDPSIVLNPTKINDTTIFKGKEMVGISPPVISSVMSQQGTVIPLIVVMVIIMAGSMVITSMGSEKENKTLETLLTLPISRTSIVFGKLIGAAIVGLVMAVIYMVGFGYYMSSMISGSSIDLAKYGLTIDAVGFILVGISLFLALFAALALCMILGIFTKNYKAAQMMTMPITFLALIPMFIIIFTDFSTLPIGMQVFMFAIPFSHPMMAMQNLMFGNTSLVLAGIGYEAIFCIVTMFIAVTLFKKDILLTGRIKSGRRKSASPFASMIKGLMARKS